MWCHDKFAQPLDKFNSTPFLYFHFEMSSTEPSRTTEQSEQGRRHSWGTVPKQSLIFELLWGPLHQIHRRTITLICSPYSYYSEREDEKNIGANPHLMFLIFFWGNINIHFLIYTASRVCMMTEIRRGEEHEVALWGWVEFTPPSPQTNYLTPLLIKSAYTAVHYKGRLIYSVYFERWSMTALRAQHSLLNHTHTQTHKQDATTEITYT